MYSYDLVVKVQRQRGDRRRETGINIRSLVSGISPHWRYGEEAEAKRFAAADAGLDGGEKTVWVSHLEDAVELDAEEFKFLSFLRLFC